MNLGINTFLSSFGFTMIWWKSVSILHETLSLIFYYLGPTGVSKAQEIVETFLEKFHETEFPDKKPSGEW